MADYATSDWQRYLTQLGGLQNMGGGGTSQVMGGGMPSMQTRPNPMNGFNSDWYNNQFNQRPPAMPGTTPMNLPVMSTPYTAQAPTPVNIGGSSGYNGPVMSNGLPMPKIGQASQQQAEQIGSNPSDAWKFFYQNY